MRGIDDLQLLIELNQNEYASEIDELKDIKLKGNLTIDEENKFLLSGDIFGTMVLKDDITLEPVDYNFNTFIGEIFLEQIKICAVLCLLLLQKVCIALVEVCAVIFEQLDMKLNLGSGRKNVNINCRFNVS